ncbi:MAG: hypothetical protein ACJ79S_17260 [Gemmatimonadaceae bacterium]
MNAIQKRAYVAPELAPQGEVIAHTLGEFGQQHTEADPSGSGLYTKRPV